MDYLIHIVPNLIKHVIDLTNWCTCFNDVLKQYGYIDLGFGYNKQVWFLHLLTLIQMNPRLDLGGELFNYTYIEQIAFILSLLLKRKKQILNLDNLYKRQ